MTLSPSRSARRRFRPARALRLEIKHSAVVWVLPVLAALFYSTRTGRRRGIPPIWTVRASVDRPGRPRSSSA